MKEIYLCIYRNNQVEHYDNDVARILDPGFGKGNAADRTHTHSQMSHSEWYRSGEKNI